MKQRLLWIPKNSSSIQLCLPTSHPSSKLCNPYEKWTFHANAYTFLQICLLLQIVFLGFEVYLGHYHNKLRWGIRLWSLAKISPAINFHDLLRLLHNRNTELCTKGSQR